MNFRKEKLNYLLTNLKKTALRDGFHCPSCGNLQSTLVARKWLVTALRRCGQCHLLFRTPTSSAMEATSFYQDSYHEANQDATALPSEEKLGEYLKAKFVTGDKHFSWYVPFFEMLGCPRGSMMLDFGCSWGYSCWQFQDAGYRVTGYEISRPQCEFARKRLGIDARWSLDDIQGPFDLVFSSHALEHVPSVSKTLEYLRGLLRPGGLLFIMTPNGSERRRTVDASSWNACWGLVHPNMLDERFYAGAMTGWPIALLSHHSSLERLQPPAFDQPVTLLDDLAGPGLLLLARKPGGPGPGRQE